MQFMRAVVVDDDIEIDLIVCVISEYIVTWQLFVLAQSARTQPIHTCCV